MRKNMEKNMEKVENYFPNEPFLKEMKIDSFL